MDQNRSEWIRIDQQCINLIYLKSDWINSDQNESKWIQMDPNGSNWISDEIIIEVYHHIFKFYFIKMDQICPKWIKLDQI